MTSTVYDIYYTIYSIYTEELIFNNSSHPTNLKVLLCYVDRPTIFKPSDAGRRDAAGHTFQTNGLVENH